MRLGLRLSLEQSQEIQVIGDARDGYTAVEKIMETQPDVALIDVDMPGISGIGALRILRKALPEMILLILSTYNDEKFIKEAMQAGANGYVLKGIGSDELIKIIKLFVSGKPVLSPYLVNLVINQHTEQIDKVNGQDVLLTLRETQILNLLSEGKRSKEMAGELFISPETVKSHIKNIYKKLNVLNRMGAVAAAKRLKILD
jgi:DNA-binding NarL/FixJ family response regulator